MGKPENVWNFLLTSGYLKVVNYDGGEFVDLALTNYEVQYAFGRMINQWFSRAGMRYYHFMEELLEGNLESLQHFMSEIVGQCLSYWDVGSGKTDSERTESFFHGLVFGLIANFYKTHRITSNRKSGFGRYDICIAPKDPKDTAALLEFKLFDPKHDTTLEDTAQRALEQIQAKKYLSELQAQGCTKIRVLAFAFRGKEVRLAAL